MNASMLRWRESRRILSVGVSRMLRWCTAPRLMECDERSSLTFLSACVIELLVMVGGIIRLPGGVSSRRVRRSVLALLDNRTPVACPS